MIQAPMRFAEWLDVLDMLKKRDNDTEVYQAMQCGKLDWSPGISDRFIEAFMDTINSRIENMKNDFSRHVARISGNDREVIQLMLGIRRELTWLEKLAKIPTIPADISDKICEMIKANKDAMQNGMEDSAIKTDRSGRLAFLLRNNAINK